MKGVYHLNVQLPSALRWHFPALTNINAPEEQQISPVPSLDRHISAYLCYLYDESGVYYGIKWCDTTWRVLALPLSCHRCICSMSASKLFDFFFKCFCKHENWRYKFVRCSCRFYLVKTINCMVWRNNNIWGFSITGRGHTDPCCEEPPAGELRWHDSWYFCANPVAGMTWLCWGRLWPRSALLATPWCEAVVNVIAAHGKTSQLDWFQDESSFLRLCWAFWARLILSSKKLCWCWFLWSNLTSHCSLSLERERDRGRERAKGEKTTLL